MPSVVQKRACAKGKSFEIANTIVSGKEAANLLNLRTEVAQTAVSRLGKIFNTTFLPLKSFNEKVDKSVFTNPKSGATVPTCINSPINLTGCPLKFVVAIIFFFPLKFFLITNKSRKKFGSIDFNHIKRMFHPILIPPVHNNKCNRKSDALRKS